MTALKSKMLNLKLTPLLTPKYGRVFLKQHNILCVTFKIPQSVKKNLNKMEQNGQKME